MQYFTLVLCNCCKIVKFLLQFTYSSQTVLTLCEKSLITLKNQHLLCNDAGQETDYMLMRVGTLPDNIPVEVEAMFEVCE